MLLANNIHLEVPELITPVVSNLEDPGALTVHSDVLLACGHSGKSTLSDVLGWSWCWGSAQTLFVLTELHL